MKHILRRIAPLLVALGLLESTAQAQTALTQTTLSAAIVNSFDQTMTVASATGWTATTTTAQTYAMIDREVVAIRTVNTTTGVIGITRGQYPGPGGAGGGRATGHVSGAVVYFLSAQAYPFALSNYERAGACSSAPTVTDPAQNASYLPVLDPNDNALFYCVGTVTSGVLSGQWYRTDITADAHTGLTASASATPTLTVGQCGGSFAMDRASGVNYKLPASVVGCTFDFVYTVAQTSGTNEIQTSALTVFMQGIVNVVGTTTMGFAAVPTTSVSIKSNDTTTGGLVGGRLHFTALTSTLWDVQGTLMGSGTVATPFSTTD
jgi:hypothetical protein